MAEYQAATQALIAVAPAAVRSGGVLQRQCACGQHTGGEEQCEDCRKQREGRLQRQAVSAAPAAAPPIVQAVLHTPGQPLDHGTRSFMEPRLGHDFARVRVYTDAPAAASAHAVGARAYTVGTQIVFGAGEYQPATAAGQLLLAHELTHVVQQQRATAALQPQLRIGPPADAAEHEAERVAEQIASGSAIDEAVRCSPATINTVQRAPNGEDEPASDTPATEDVAADSPEAYLAALTSTGQIEGRPESDNKARELVRRRAELGPFNTAVKVLLTRELLHGAATGADERAILELLRDASIAERAEIAGQIGRDELWRSFGGANRRAIEALTLTDADFADPALIERLRKLGRSQLQDYLDNALDPAVRARIEDVQRFQRITTPLDASARTDPSGKASLVINGIEVTVLPDTRTDDEQLRQRARTRIEIDSDPANAIETANDADSTVTNFVPPPPLRATIQTIYGPGMHPRHRSEYGRGTTVADRGAGTTSVGFHESQHGLDYLAFMRDNPPPQFTGAKRQPLAEFQKAESAYQRAINDYSERIQRFSVEQTDCPGTPTPPEELEKGGASATICIDLAKQPQP